jgi:PAS domain S-box-containing protein
MARKALTTLPVKLALLLLLAGIPAILLRLIAAAGERDRVRAALSPDGAPTESAPALVEALGAVDANLVRDLLILGALALLFAAGAGMASYVILRRPLLALSKQAKSISTGSEAPLTSKPYTEELATLAVELDSLRGALAERTAHLEKEVGRYNSLLEGLPEVVYLYDASTDAGASKSFINGQIEVLTGYTPEEWLADPKLWSRSLYEADSERVLSDYERSCKTSVPFNCEYRITTKDGSIRWVHDRATVAADDTGKVSLMCGTMLDITARKEAHERLSTRFGRLEAVLDAAGDATVGLDHHHTIVLFNAAAERQFRMERADVIGQHVSTLFEDEPYIAPKIRLDLHGKRSDGSVFIADTVISYTQDTEVGFFLLTMREVTEVRAENARIRTESERLREGEANFRRMFLANPLPMWLYDAETLEFIEVSDAAVARYGYTREEFLAMQITDLRAPEVVPRLVESGPVKLHDQQFALQARHRCKNGQIIDVQLISVAWEHEGRSATLVVAEDVTERKEAEEALKESEKRFRAFFEGTAIGVAMVDMEGRIVKSNNALHGLLGYSSEELRGAVFDSLRHPEDGGSVPSPLTTLASLTTDHLRTEWRFIRRDGAVIWANLTASMVRGSKQQQQFCIYMVEDVTERRRHQEQIRSQLDRLAALRNVDMAISGSLDLRVTLSLILDEVLKQLKVDASDVLLLNPHTQVLEYAAGRGFRTNGVSRTRVRFGEGYAGRAAMHHKTHSVSNITESGDLMRAPLLMGEDFVSYTAVPLIAKGQVKGVLEVFHRCASEPDAEWLGFLEALAGQAAIAIDNAAMYYDLQRSNVELTLAYDVTLEGWSRALDLRDRETEGHTQRVTDMTMRLARHMGTPEPELVHIHRGALLHDIGKMGIPDSILLKAGPLTKEEWEIMRLHPVYAYELLSPISFLRPAIDIPYCHHEKWDGSGYPRGLRGEQIPLAARIFAVIDVWDALRSDRPYRKAWPEPRVREHIKSLAGTHFDPRVVDAFLQIEPPPQEHPSNVPLDRLLELIERRKAEEGLPEVPWAATERTASVERTPNTV